MKKICMFIAVAVLCMFGCVACGGGSDEKFEFELNADGTGYVLVSSALYSGTVTVPSTYKDKPVVKIGDNVFAAREKITAIVIPDSVTEIGEKSFFNCDGLTELTLSENLISIGNSAFGGCDGLKTVKIPDGVKHIGNSAFSGCIRLATVELPDDLEIIDDFAFAQCYALTELDCPDSLKSIGGEAFKMSGLVRVRFNIALESVGYSAFYLCDRLIEVQNFDISIAPEGARYQIGLHDEIRYFDEEETSEIVTTDDGYMFYKGDITFNSLYSDVHSVLVAYKGNETALRLPDDFEDKPYSVYGNAFCRNVDLTSVNIPSTVKLIGRRAFYDCDNLTNVEIAAEKLDYETFFGCEKLKTATIDKNCRDFGYNAMIGMREIRYTGSVNDWLNVKIECSYSAPFSERCLLYIDGQPLKNVTIAGSTNSVPEHIFNGIFTLESVTIEEGVNEIQKDAFACCYSLKHVSLPDSLNFIGERAFGSCDVLDYNIYEGGYYLGNSKNPYVALMRTKENGGMDSIVMPSAAGGSVTVHADTKILYDHSLNGWRDALSVVIPDKITCIGECALNGMSNIENIVVPNSVKYIGRDAFSSCAKLKSITLPAGIENFSYHMLAYCVSLTEIRYGGSAESWEKIDKYSTDWDLNTGDYTLVYLNGGI